MVADTVHLAEALDPIAPVEAAPAPVRVSWDESRRIPILMYHDLGTPASGLTVTPDALHKQVDALVDAGYEAVSLDTVLRALRGEPVWLPEKGVVLTFDDAYDGVYREAYPVLKSHGLKGTLFVIAGLVGRKGYVNWDQVRELAADGWTIGCHTVHHQDLRLLGGKQLEDEVVLSRRVLQENTGQAVVSFCYPAGKYDDLVIQAVKSGGYYGAVTTEPGIVAVRDAPFTLRRVRVDGRDGLDVFKAKLSIP
jgi:peptidoglycan/xylan/chitin deacetylase (PgdA/CDA1 family)